MLIVVNWGFPYSLANVELILAQVQGIRCLAADVSEMTLHNDFRLGSVTC